MSESPLQKTNPNDIRTPIDILLPTHGRLDLTMTSINAIYTHTTVPFHLIVVDDSTDETPAYFERIQKEHDNITFVHSDEPFKNGNQIFNTGFANMKHDFVATVMNSVMVEPEWEMVALQLMEDDPTIGAIGFKCLFPHNGRIESAGIAMHRYQPMDIGRDLPGHRLSNVYECEAVQWAFALLRKSAVIGNIEEDVFHGFVGWDDIDNCFVLRHKGWKIMYCGLGAGYHRTRATRGTNDPDALMRNIENGEAFCKRWGYWDEYLKDHPERAPELVEKT